MAEDLNPLYKSLQEAIKNENDEQALRLSEQILLSTPKDQEIFICKIIALIKVSKLNEAFNLINPKEVRSDVNLAYAYSYSLYKLNKYNECLTFVKDYQNDSSITHPGFLLLEAQIFFKQGKVEDSVKLYLTILKKFASSEEFGDMVVNLLAAGNAASESLQRNVVELGEDYTRRSDALREAFFNLSLIYTNMGNFFLYENSNGGFYFGDIY